MWRKNQCRECIPCPVPSLLQELVSLPVCHELLHWPLPAVRDLTRDGSLSTYDENVLKLSKASFRPGKCALMGDPSKLPSPTKLAWLGHFPPASQAGRLAGPVFYTISSLCLWGGGDGGRREDSKRRVSVEKKRMWQDKEQNCKESLPGKKTKPVRMDPNSIDCFKSLCELYLSLLFCYQLYICIFGPFG